MIKNAAGGGGQIQQPQMIQLGGGQQIQLIAQQLAGGDDNVRFDFIKKRSNVFFSVVGRCTKFTSTDADCWRRRRPKLGPGAGARFPAGHRARWANAVAASEFLPVELFFWTFI